jgi:glycine/D-amino acid oxidase-like deaminating enzyme
MAQDADVIVVGGGVLGCASAYRLADELDVLVLEREQLAAGASGDGAGVVSPTLFYERVPAVARLCNEFMRDFEGAGFTEHPRLELITDEATGRERASELADAGFPVEYLDADAVEDRYEPITIDWAVGAIEFRDTGYLDTAALTAALGDAARERGAEIRTGTAVEEILTRDGRSVGVETRSDTIRADTVVAAAGWANPTVLPDDVSVPVAPYRTQCLTVALSESSATEVPIVRRHDMGIYARPWDDTRLLVGGGSGALSEAEGSSTHPDSSFRETTRRAVSSFLPAETDATIESGWTGIAGQVKDGWPIIAEPLSGLVVVQGAVMGIMGSPALSAAVDSVVTGAEYPFDPSVFALDRFDDPTETFEIHSVSSGHYQA